MYTLLLHSTLLDAPAMVLSPLDATCWILLDVSWSIHQFAEAVSLKLLHDGSPMAPNNFHGSVPGKTVP